MRRPGSRRGPRVGMGVEESDVPSWENAVWCGIGWGDAQEDRLKSAHLGRGGGILGREDLRRGRLQETGVCSSRADWKY